ncbi:hypothetical protein ACWGOQ_0008370 [Aquimarina sp. M1]
MKKVILIVTLAVVGFITSCRDTKKEKVTVVKEVEVEKKEKGVLERAAEKADEEIDEQIDKMGDDN